MTIVSHSRATSTGGRSRMSYDNVLGLVIALLLAAFLVAALVVPEKF